jgi:predicted translin family RNA/ssDNA-binding protein
MSTFTTCDLSETIAKFVSDLRQVYGFLQVLYTTLCDLQYVMKFVSDLRQVGGFLRLLQFPPPIKLTTPIYM